MSFPKMDQFTKLGRTYRLTESDADRLQLGEDLYRIVEPKFHLYVFSKLTHHAADEELQGVLRAIVVSVPAFAGQSTPELGEWCYRITKHKIADHIRKQSNERLQAMPPKEPISRERTPTQTGGTGPRALIIRDQALPVSLFSFSE